MRLPRYRAPSAIVWSSALLLMVAPAEAGAQLAGALDVSDGWRRMVTTDGSDWSRMGAEDGAWAFTSLSASWSAQGLVGVGGAVWYRRAVTLPPALIGQGARPALLVGPFAYGAYRVFADGILVGVVGSDAHPVPYPRGQVLELPWRATEDGVVALALEVRPATWTADAVGAGSAVLSQLLLGSADVLVPTLEAQERATEKAFLADLVFAVLTSAVGLFHLILFGTRRAQVEYLWFGAACLAFAVNALAPSPWMAPVFDDFGPPYRLTDASGHFAAGLLLLFLWRVFSRTPGRAMRAYILSHPILGLFVLVAPLSWVSASATLRFLWLFPGVAAALLLLASGLRDANPDAKALLVSLLSIAAAEGAEFLRMSGAPLPAFLPYAGFTVALFSAAAMLAGRFARHLEDLGALRRSLEERVAERTAMLRDTMQQAQAASEAKSRFLTNMSHELRTPLNAVIGFATVLIKRARVTHGTFSQKELGFLERIRANGVHLLALVDGVMDLSAIEAGAVRLESRSVDLGPLIRGILADMSPRADVKGVKLESVVPTHTLPFVTDPVRLGQILVNLVDNAIRFTERGRITITVVTDGARVRLIEVRDTGIGIPAEKLPTVFEAFAQVDDTTARRHFGMGLGLSITRALCDLLRYRLTLESEPGVGTVARVDLAPAASGSRAEREPTRAVAPT